MASYLFLGSFIWPPASSFSFEIFSSSLVEVFGSSLVEVFGSDNAFGLGSCLELRRSFGEAQDDNGDGGRSFGEAQDDNVLASSLFSLQEGGINTCDVHVTLGCCFVSP